MTHSPSGAIVTKELVCLGAAPADKTEAIREASNLLIAAGCIEAGYQDSMIRREAVANTFLGHGVAIPHGLGQDRGMVKQDGIAILQVPGGVEWNAGQRANLVVAIAAKSDSHISILRRLTGLIQDSERLDALCRTKNPADLIDALSKDVSGDEEHPPAQDLSEAFEWEVSYPAGLHARPASAWVEAARRSPVRVQVRHGNEMADARNLVALLRLGLKLGDKISISSEGDGADQALRDFRAKIDALTFQEKADAARAAEHTAAPVGGWTPPGPLQTIAGVAASPGVVIGTIHVLASDNAEVPDEPAQLTEGCRILQEALLATHGQLDAMVDDTTRRLGAHDAAIFKAQSEILNDSDLITLTCQLMVEGHGVAWSWNQAIERLALKLSSLGNPVLAARAADLRDVGRRVLIQLYPGLVSGTLSNLPDHACIIAASDLSPSDTAGLDTNRVVGMVTAMGGPTSHTAILARTLGLPAMVAGGSAVMEIAEGTPAILDGQTGCLYLAPTEDDVASASAWIKDRAERRAAEEAERGLPATTRDGHQIAIGANVNRPDQVSMALSEGAEGVGLMRTEFLFLEHGQTPSEDEQFDTYRGMITALGDRPLIVRALDIGGDKQVAHLHLPTETNPFLGVRGSRLLLRRFDLLEPQLRALYRAADCGGDLSIMFPMVTTVDEVETLRFICERIRKEMNAPEIPFGIMIEVPAAALQADILAAYVDFFSIGTNDLTQYTLAIDRQNPDLAAAADSLNPAVLRLVQRTVQGAARFNRWVGVCGGIAGDPFGASILAGLGVNELSMTPREIPPVKARLRTSDFNTLKLLAERALDAKTAAQVRGMDTNS